MGLIDFVRSWYTLEIFRNYKKNLQMPLGKRFVHSVSGGHDDYR